MHEYTHAHTHIHDHVKGLAHKVVSSGHLWLYHFCVHVNKKCFGLKRSMCIAVCEEGKVGSYQIIQGV